MIETLTLVTHAHGTKVRIAKTTSRFGVASLRYVDGVFEIVGVEVLGGEATYEMRRVGTTGETTKARSRYVFKLDEIKERAESAKKAAAARKVHAAERKAAIADFRSFLMSR